MKQMLNLWSVCNRIIPKEWIELVKADLEPDPQYNGVVGSEKRLRLLKRIKLKVEKSSTIKFLVEEIMLLYEGKMYMMTTR